MIGGAFLPWLTFYAGLYPIRGVLGLWGRLLAIGGGLCALAGVVAWRRPGSILMRAIAILGGTLTAFAIWLMVQLLLTLQHLYANPMVVPGVGPGLFVVLAGALLATAPTLWHLRARHAAGET